MRRRANRSRRSGCSASRSHRSLRAGSTSSSRPSRSLSIAIRTRSRISGGVSATASPAAVRSSSHSAAWSFAWRRRHAWKYVATVGPSARGRVSSIPLASTLVYVEMRQRVEEHIRRHELIPPGGTVTCLVSGGADSPCLWHVLRELGYGVSALHVDHGLRGEESDADARFCADVLGAEVVDGRGGTTEEELREIRYSFATDRLRATGHTASDQVETLLYRLVASGVAKGIKPKREDGVVRPLLGVWRSQTEEYCRAAGLAFRTDSTNEGTKRGLIRDQILPLLRELHPGAERNLLRLAEGEPSRLEGLLASAAGS